MFASHDRILSPFPFSMGGCCSASAMSAEDALAAIQEQAPEIQIEGEEFLFAFAFTRDQVRSHK